MDRTERFYKIKSLLRTRRVVPIEVFLKELEVSPATFKRDVEYMRTRLHSPIVWDRQARGYRISFEPKNDSVHELPGLWFSASELYALLAAQKLLSDIDPGILSHHTAPLTARISELLELSGRPSTEIAKRVRLLTIANRRVEPKFFAEIAAALVDRQKIKIEAWNREREEVNTRLVSPQRLVHYRDNWYLDAWCHLRESLRSFAVDTLRSVSPTEELAKEIPEPVLDEHYTSAYGIFAGKIKDWAVLRFSPLRARWVEGERWHPQQAAERLPDGAYCLRIPYSDEREILMDILRHGSNVVVESPASLKKLVQEEVKKIEKLYSAP
jgi:predicted DNA-binding transcriptional regulator YafY